MIASLSFLGFASVLCSFLISGVEGHGYIQNVTIGGKTYPGWDPNIDPYAQPIPKRVIRKIPDDGPVTDVTSPDLACNQGGEKPAGLVATADAGSQVKWVMNRWPDDHLGPVFHYMASCDGDCTTFDTTNAKWFKVDQDGYDNGVWATTKLINNNLEVTMTIPAQLKAGQYLMRHELVALHDADQPQFYPSCAQVNVQGSGTQEPSASDLVSIPGVYDNVKFPDIWDDNFHSFTFPAPQVAFATGGTTTAGTSASPAQSSSAHSSSSATPSHTSSSTSGAQASASSSVVSSSSAAATGKCKASSTTPPTVSTSSSAAAAFSSSSPPKCKPRSRMAKRRPAAKYVAMRHAARAKRH